MKGVKCIGYRKLFIILVLLFVPLFILLNTSNANAASLGTSSFDLNYFTNNGSYTWRNGILYGRSNGTSIVYGAARRYQWNTPSINYTGSYASIHFETNLVISTDDIQYIFGYWTNLDQMSITSCAVNGVAHVPVASAVSFATTDWTEVINGTTYYNNTLTVYGDVILDNIPSGNSGSIVCSVGSSDYAFYTNNTDNPDLFYFEQNPMSIDFSNNINDALLKSQINQTNIIINQNQGQIDQDNKDRSDLQNQSNDAQSDAAAAGQQITGGFSNLLTIIGNFVNIVIHPPASDCTINGNMGHMDLGTIDLCQLTPPPAISVIGSILLIGFIIPFAYSFVLTLLNILKGVTED